MLNTERHQPLKYSALYNNRSCAVSLRKQMCSLLHKIIEHPSLAGMKYHTTAAYVISNTWNLNIVLKELEQQQKKRSGCSYFPFALKRPFSPRRGPRGRAPGPAELCRPGSEAHAALHFPPAGAQPPSPLPGRGRFPAKASAHPLSRFRLQMKYNCRAERGKMGFFMRHSVHCVNGLLINHGWPQNPLQNPKSCHITDLSVLILSAHKRKHGHQFSRRNDTAAVNPFGCSVVRWP